MAIKLSGNLGLNRDIETEFQQGTNPVMLSEYYRGGPNVPNGPAGNAKIATAGLQKLSNYYGGVKQDLCFPTNIAPAGAKFRNGPYTLSSKNFSGNVKIYHEIDMGINIRFNDHPGLESWYRTNTGATSTDISMFSIHFKMSNTPNPKPPRRDNDYFTDGGSDMSYWFELGDNFARLGNPTPASVASKDAGARSKIVRFQFNGLRVENSGGPISAKVNATFFGHPQMGRIYQKFGADAFEGKITHVPRPRDAISFYNNHVWTSKIPDTFEFQNLIGNFAATPTAGTTLVYDTCHICLLDDNAANRLLVVSYMGGFDPWKARNSTSNYITTGIIPADPSAANNNTYTQLDPRLRIVYWRNNADGTITVRLVAEYWNATGRYWVQDPGVNAYITHKWTDAYDGKNWKSGTKLSSNGAGGLTDSNGLLSVTFKPTARPAGAKFALIGVSYTHPDGSNVLGTPDHKQIVP